MSWNDDKLIVLERARIKYQSLKKLIGREPALELPESLKQAIAEYENLSAVYNSSALENSLKKYWKEIPASDEIRLELEEIANYQLKFRLE